MQEIQLETLNFIKKVCMKEFGILVISANMQQLEPGISELTRKISMKVYDILVMNANMQLQQLLL